MSKHKTELALAFLQSHPDAAAAILEQQATADIVVLLENIPPTVAAPVLESMLPQYSARLCKNMAPERISPFLSLMNFSVVSAILRHSTSEVRHQLIELLPEKTRLACLFLLNYPEDTVGAWMIVQATTVPGDSTVDMALKALVDQREMMVIDWLFVLDRDRRLLGELSCAELLREQPGTAISTLITEKTPVLLGRTNLETAHKMHIWEHRDSIAIINRENKFVGVLRHMDLRRGLVQVANVIESPSGSDPITSILSVYGSSLFSLLDSVGEFAANKNH